MKIPFTKYHIVKTQVLCDKLLTEQELIMTREKLDALRALTDSYVPEMEELHIALHEAKIGSNAYGRRKARRKVLEKARILKESIKAA